MSMSAFVPPTAVPSARRPRSAHAVVTSAASSRRPPPSELPRAGGSPLASLHELTERIADLLHVSPHPEAGHGLANDAAAAAGREHVPHTLRVALVFAKQLRDQQVTIEYARRLVSLAKHLHAPAASAPGDHAPVVAFIDAPEDRAGRAERPVATSGTAGYLLFRSICAQAGLDLSPYQFLLEADVTTALAAIRRRVGPEDLPGAQFTVISSDYHLFYLQEVLRLAPRQSSLFHLQAIRASCSFVFAFYPFCVSKDPVTAFLGRVTVISSELAIVLRDLDNVLAGAGFFNAENGVRLRQAAAKLRDMNALIQSPKAIAAEGGFKTDMRRHCEVLEACSHALREVEQGLSGMAQGRGEPVERQELERARLLLNGVIGNIARSFDPDRPLVLQDCAEVVQEVRGHVASRSGAEGVEGAAGDEGDDTGEEKVEEDSGRAPPTAAAPKTASQSVTSRTTKGKRRSTKTLPSPTRNEARPGAGATS